MDSFFIYCRRSSEGEDHQTLSLESQERELIRLANTEQLAVVEILSESMSARTPGRPVFKEMLRRIRKGEATGIIAWHPDRLARNAVDGGEIIDLLDRGTLHTLRFPTFTFENSSQGKFMLAIVFGYSKYQVDMLSDHVKRGNRTKREMGWLPNRAPIGYLNTKSDLGTSIITKDPERFPLIKVLWERFLTGQYTVAELTRLAKDMGLRTRRSWRIGGKPLQQNAMCQILRNPFYGGRFVFEGSAYLGKHEPMISAEDFDYAQRVIGRHRIRQSRRHFLYRGLMRCGHCDSTITAESKVNRQGHHYTYYHCTHKNRTMPCSERGIEEKNLTHEMQALLYDRLVDVSSSAMKCYLLRSRTTIVLSDKKLALKIAAE